MEYSIEYSIWDICSCWSRVQDSQPNKSVEKISHPWARVLNHPDDNAVSHTKTVDTCHVSTCNVQFWWLDPMCFTASFEIRVFPKIVVPQTGWFIMDILIKMDDLGVKFLETPIWHRKPPPKKTVDLIPKWHNLIRLTWCPLDQRRTHKLRCLRLGVPRCPTKTRDDFTLTRE